MLNDIFLSASKNYMPIILILVAAINLTAILLMWLDKHNAKHHKRRIPELVLLAFAALFGSVGILLGMLLFHHKTNKTRHAAFTTGVPIILLVQLLALLFIAASFG